MNERNWRNRRTLEWRPPGPNNLQDDIEHTALIAILRPAYLCVCDDVERLAIRDIGGMCCRLRLYVSVLVTMLVLFVLWTEGPCESDN